MDNFDEDWLIAADRTTTKFTSRFKAK